MSFTTYNIPEPHKSETSHTKKWLWILTNHAFSAPHEELLQKICQALKADFPEDVFVMICDPANPVSMSDQIREKPTLILSFGIQPSAIGIWIDLDAPGIRFSESFCFILSVPLDELLNHPSSKKQLWSSMQSYLHVGEHHA